MKNSDLLRLIRKSYESVGIFNKNNVSNKVFYWKKYLPNITPYYAIKSLNSKYMINELIRYNFHFDIASKGELYQLMSLKYPLNRTILANPCSSIDDINIAVKFRVPYIVCDDIESVNYINRIDKGIKIIWRIKSYEDNSLVKFNSKFGASIVDTIKVISRCNNIYGLSFHVGSGCSNMESFGNTLNIIKKNILPYWKGNCSLIDIGGGMTNIEDIRNLSNIIKPYITDDCMKNMKWIAEPGRYFSSDSIDLYTKIIRVKYINNHYHVYINDSIYNSFSGKMFDYQIHYPMTVYKRYETNELVKATVWGNTCDGLDMIIDNIFIDKPVVGNILKWSNMGAYSVVSASDKFNGFKKAKIVMI
jgi:ornithine decarboxylase